MFEEQQIDEFAKELSEHFGPLLTQHQLAKLLDRSLGGLRYSLCRAERPDMAALKACGRKALEDVANAANSDTIMGWYRRLVARKFDGSKSRRYPGRSRIAHEIEQLVVRMAKENSD